MIFILIFVENCLLYYAIHDFSVWLRIGSNPADINLIQCHIGKIPITLDRSHAIAKAEITFLLLNVNIINS